MKKKKKKRKKKKENKTEKIRKQNLLYIFGKNH